MVIMSIIYKKVQVIVFKSREGEVLPYVLLLQTREGRGFIWQNITGSVDPIDSQNKGKDEFLSAAIREVFEETGVEISNRGHIRELPFEFEFKDRWGRDIIEKLFFTTFYEGRDRRSKVKIKLDETEHQNYVWKRVDDISKDDYAYDSNFKSFLCAYKNLR